MPAFGGKADSDQPLLTNLDLWVHAPTGRRWPQNRFHPELARLPLSPLAGEDEFSRPSCVISARQASQPLISRSISASVATGGMSIILWKGVISRPRLVKNRWV